MVRGLSELLQNAGIEPILVRGTPTVVVSAVADDSRKVAPGSCFVAVGGVKGHGADFVNSALSAGAVAVVADRDVSIPDGVAFVQVPDARIAAAKLASELHGVSAACASGSLNVVGVTGTNGKTTVCWMLRSMLRAAGNPTALLGTVEFDLIGRTYPAPLTTPGPVEVAERLVEAMQAGATHALMEVSSHALDQHRTDGLRFRAAVFTNLTGDHLDYHGTTEAYSRSKRRLFDGLDESSVAVVNSDDSRAAYMVSGTAARIARCGINRRDADLRAIISASDGRGTTIRLQGMGLDHEIRLQLIGEHNVRNALSATATAVSLGVPVERILHALRNLAGVPGRLQSVDAGQPFHVFVDYAHTDDALRNVLSSLRGVTTGRLICVFGCGGERDRGKRPRMGAVAARLSDLLVVTSDNPRHEDPGLILDDILAGLNADQRVSARVDPDRRNAIGMAVALAGPGDVVLIAGKGHETYQLVGDRVLPFDDVQVARECLERRNPVVECVV